jgi:hypothetical protein
MQGLCASSLIWTRWDIDAHVSATAYLFAVASRESSQVSDALTRSAPTSPDHRGRRKHRLWGDQSGDEPPFNQNLAANRMLRLSGFEDVGKAAARKSNHVGCASRLWRIRRPASFKRTCRSREHCSINFALVWKLVDALVDCLWLAMRQDNATWPECYAASALNQPLLT